MSAKGQSLLRPLASLIVLSLLVIQGCSRATQHAGPVDQETAVLTLKQCLDTWKQGLALSELNTALPEVVVQDMDWAAQMKLQEYEILGDPQPVDSNLLIDVKLQLTINGTENKTKTVTYIVGTDPVLTVFRKLF